MLAACKGGPGQGAGVGVARGSVYTTHTVHSYTCMSLEHTRWCLSMKTGGFNLCHVLAFFVVVALAVCLIA
jgi:hypothetical protein